MGELAVAAGGVGSFFHNCIYDEVFEDAAFRKPISVDDLLQKHGPETKLLVVGIESPGDTTLFLDFAAALGSSPWLRRQAVQFRDRRRTRMQDFFLAATSPLQRVLADQNSPQVARRWGFRMNLGLDAFESTFMRFVDATQGE